MVEGDGAAEYQTNRLGDVHEIVHDGVRAKFDPSTWEWLDGPAEARRSIDGLAVLPGFSVEERAIDCFTPGVRSRGGGEWMNWKPGAAPPAAVESKIDRPDGTRARYNRLSDAVGDVALHLPVHPERSPMGIYDFLRGRLFVVRYQPPPVGRAGAGTVYLVEDGVGVKVGFTEGPLARRIAALQTGNPRRITPIAEVRNASPHLEVLLQQALAEWNIGGEWYDRGSLLMQIQEANGVESWLSPIVGPDVAITVSPPYR